MERNRQLAARAGQTSLTIEEEARLKLLLGPDAEGDEGDGMENKKNRNNNNDEDQHDDTNPLFKDVFGGIDDAKKLAEVDEKLKEVRECEE